MTRKDYEIKKSKELGLDATKAQVEEIRKESAKLEPPKQQEE